MIGFYDIPGNASLGEKVVKNVLDKRVSHTQLFFSNDGAGALPLAVLYAKILLCKDVKVTGACDVCSSCVQVNTLNHADIHFLLPNSVAKKDGDTQLNNQYQKDFRAAFLENPFMTMPEWRALQDDQKKQLVIKKPDAIEFFTRLNLKSSEGGNRIGIIWKPELLNPNASNMLLKFLEEPPEKTYFVLVTDKPEEVLPTIISRAQLLKLTKPTEEEICSALVGKLDITEQLAQVLCESSSASFGAALYLYKEFKLGDKLFTDFRDWMRLCFVKNVGGLNTWIEKYNRENGRESIIHLMTYALSIFRRVVHWQYCQSMAGILNAEEKSFIENFSPFVNERNILKFVSTFNEAIEDMEWNGNANIIMTDLTYKVMVLLKK